MSYKGIINAFQKTSANFEFGPAQTFSEQFAQGRYLKKMEVPDSSRVSLLSDRCWSEWIGNDESLPGIGLLPLSEWYIARESLHRGLGQYRIGEIQFPKGSEFTPTRGKNSLEARLSSSDWTCTRDNFDVFCRLCYTHAGLKRATRKRYDRWFNQKDFDVTRSESEKFLFRKFKNVGNPGYSIFRWKLERITSFVEGSRFSTVPKNNEKRRPINIEPFGNILVQRSLGEWFRTQIHEIWGLDLNTLASTQRVRIQDVEGIATVDLSNASDSISMDLCRFLLPRRIMKLLEDSRSPMVLGPDGNYYLPKKISSMGNGFTFELMTLILTAVCRVLDPEATVFGDDIIIKRGCVPRLLELFSSVGLKVNVDKTFSDGPFRESCGANFHQVEGYIESYDFLYPETIGDCVLIWNKVVRLGHLYPSFKKLQANLYRSIPPDLRGGPDVDFLRCDALDLIDTWTQNEDTVATFPLFFVTPKVKGKEPDPKVSQCIRDLQIPGQPVLVPGFEYKERLRTATLKHLSPRRHWAKYLMYLGSGRRAKDVLSGSGEWVRVWFVASGGRHIRASSLTT